MPKRLNKQRAISLLEKADKLKKQERRRTVIVPGPDNGDRLARGASSATFRMPNVADEKWDWIWLADKEFKQKYGHAKTKDAPEA